MLIWGQNLGRPECPYLRRWVLDFKLFSLRVHRWLASDDPRHRHDHPWWFLTLVLWGGYTDDSLVSQDKLGFLSVRYRPSSWAHTVRVKEGGCWTVMLTGPEVREWGFWVNGTRWRKRNKYFYEFGNHPCSAGDDDEERR